jgi:V8-like Glu-specific endopeptidase
VYVVGHPGGRELTFSLSDNKVLGFRSPKLHYRTPTEGGSSGSPVFTADWDVLALHHAGSKNLSTLDGKAEYPANEGIWIDAIRRGVRKKGAGAARAKGTRKHS